MVKRMVTTFGGIELDRDEKSFLALGPDYAMFDDLVMENIENEMKITTTYHRLSLPVVPRGFAERHWLHF